MHRTRGFLALAASASILFAACSSGTASQAPASVAPASVAPATAIVFNMSLLCMTTLLQESISMIRTNTGRKSSRSTTA